MKAVVVEIKDGYAALLRDDGSVVKMKNRNFTIGDVVNMKEKTMRRKSRFSAMMAVAAMLVVIMGAGVCAYATPYYYVSLDVNPSILMQVNLFERVIGMEAANEDAAAVLEGLNLNNRNIEDAISEAVARIAEAGYFGEEGANILISSTAKNNDKAERLAGKLKGAVEDEIAENGVKAEVAAGAMGYDMVQEAKELGITPGKLNIITNLLGEEVGDNINESIKDLMARYTATKGAEGRAKGAAADVDKEDVEPAENAGLKEQNATGKAEQADRQEVNAVVDTPASDNKSPNADNMENNATDKTPQVNSPYIPEKPDVPAGGRP